MSYDKNKLLKDLRAALGDKEVLSLTRRFLGGIGLADAKIANWRRDERKLPDSLVEGAALYHCLKNRAFDELAAERTGVVAHTCWQAFFVSDSADKNNNHDCSVFRLWSGIRQFRRDNRERFFIHKTWFTGDGSERVSELVANDDVHLDQKIFSQTPEGSELAVRWKIPWIDPREVGYNVRLKSTVAGKPSKGQRHEYLGGLTGIPVERLFLIASIPKRLLTKSQDLLDFNEGQSYKAPKCLEFLADGVPIHVLEGFLQGRLDLEWLLPWFDSRGTAQPWDEAGHSLPKPIADLALQQELSLSSPDHESFVFRVDSPAPYLYYSLVFELPER